MWIVSPDGKEKRRVKYKSDVTRTLLRAGWKDVTPPPSPKQLKHRIAFRQSGDLHRVKTMLRILSSNSELHWSAADKSMLRETESIVTAKIKRMFPPKPI